ncbi:hypothetical protein ACRPOS_007790 [Bartonella heixiaziensis]|uniref:hypothetical protein n=1 Tax=Bartonella heixiaziensis TaxID=1461000 RepID=UPI00390888AB
MSIPNSSERMPLKKRAITKVGDKVLEAFDCHKDGRFGHVYFSSERERISKDYGYVKIG